MTSKITYLGELRTSSIHIGSGTEILSDAPKDNRGKGEAFSPTDTVANALGSCMISIMGIKAMDMGLDMKGSTVEVTKVMQAEPRKIAKIGIVVNMTLQADEKTRTIMERVAMTCPVSLSLHPDIEQDVVINWPS
ncbi:OsmC family protein [Flavobacterium sp. DGU11]|uniref:OsmC family protein n=1 Tax=Flavobacterium arundinis TaxID=3139143 RepID=A0ABU9HTS8_9FLAO